jgi:hypothetical protein
MIHDSGIFEKRLDTLPKRKERTFFANHAVVHTLASELEEVFLLLKGEAAGTLSTTKLKSFLVDMGLKKKSSHVKAMFQAIDSKRKAVLTFSEFAQSLPVSSYRFLASHLDFKKKKWIQMERRTLVDEGALREQEEAAIKIQGQVRRKRDQKRVEQLWQDQGKQEEEEEEEEELCARRIQGLARGRKARREMEEKKEEGREREVSKRMTEEAALMHILQDTFHETFSNLLVEHVYGEFDLFAEPSHFLTRRHEEEDEEEEEGE